MEIQFILKYLYKMKRIYLLQETLSIRERVKPLMAYSKKEDAYREKLMLEWILKERVKEDDRAKLIRYEIIEIDFI